MTLLLFLEPRLLWHQLRLLVCRKTLGPHLCIYQGALSTRLLLIPTTLLSIGRVILKRVTGILEYGSFTALLVDNGYAHLSPFNTPCAPEGILQLLKHISKDVDNPSEPMPVSGSSALVDEDVDMDDFQF
ncbi:hypothetical protein B0H10DRAFT_1955146, partial [Mycena sp. CBHHK59/15]